MTTMTELRVDRRSAGRRTPLERRLPGQAETARPAARTPQPRRKAERRRQIDPTTCERDYSDDEVLFMRAMDEYKRKSGRMFPTWSEVLEVLVSIGYRRVAEPQELTEFKMG